MAKRKAARPAKPMKSSRKRPAKRRSAPRPVVKRKAKTKASAKKKAPRKIAGKKTAPVKKPVVKATAKVPGKVPRLDRARKILVERETHDTPPSSLDMDRRGSAAASGRAEMAQSARNTRGMSADITGGDVDVDVEDAYFTGDEAPGGDNPSPDLEVVDDIGKALGVTYDDNEELQGSGKVEERDKHRWELDPASSDDFKDRD